MGLTCNTSPSKIFSGFWKRRFKPRTWPYIDTKISVQTLSPCWDLNLPIIWYLALLERVSFSLVFNHLSSRSGSTSLSNMTWILKLLYITSLTHTSVSASVISITVYRISSNTKLNCSSIEPFTRFRTTLTCVDWIFLKPILIPFRLLRYYSVIFTLGFCNFCSKIHVIQPQTWHLFRVSIIVLNLDIDSVLIADIIDWISGIWF